MTFIALLRAINLGNHRSLAMSALRDFIADLSFTDPRTLLQTGNVVFRGEARSAGDLEQAGHKVRTEMNRLLTKGNRRTDGA